MKLVVLLIFPLLLGCNEVNEVDNDFSKVPLGDSIGLTIVPHSEWKSAIDTFALGDHETVLDSMSIWEYPQWLPYKDFESIKKGDKFWIEYGMEYARFNVTKHDVKQRLIHGLKQNTIAHGIWTEHVWDYPQFRTLKHRIR